MTAESVASAAAVVDHNHEDSNLLQSRELMKEKIVSALRDPKVAKVGMYGVAEVGKTFLARQVGQLVKGDMFNVVSMTSVSQTLDVERIQREIADQLNEESSTVNIHERIKKEESILIILDDVSGVIDLERLGIPLAHDTQKGGKFLLISRDQHVLQENETQQKFKLEVLDYAESWSLFQTRAGDDVLKDTNSRSIAKQLAQRCSGLPIAVVQMAESFKAVRCVSYLKDALRIFNNDYGKLEETIYSIAALSYDQLKDDEVKQVFLLCGVYGKSILVGDLLKYVIGLGMFKHLNSIDGARNGLQNIIGTLKASSLVLDHGEREIQMHDLVRDFAKSVASGDGYVFTMERTVPSKDWPREDFLERCSQIILDGNYIQTLPERLDCPNLKLLHLDSARNSTLNVPDSFFEGMPNLQVLDLMGMVIQPELPTSLLSLTKLKTLCLNACSLGYMKGIAALRNLEVLSFFQSSIKKFPVEIVQLDHLRMLDLSSSEIDDDATLSDILSDLKKLEELYLGNLDNLEKICHDQLIIDSFQKLHVIKVKSCGRLEYLLLASKMNNFSQLVEIEVAECGSMKTIVLLDNDTTTDEIESIPVCSLTLQHLPAINGFCCNDSKSIAIPTLFPNEKALFRPLKHLKLISISRIRLLVITALSKGMVPLQNLKKLEIVDCNDLQYLFVIKGRNMHENYGGLLPHLRQLCLRNLSKLRSIVGLNHPRRTLSFQMLNQLIVCGCNQLRYLLPLYALQNLQQLQNIVIRDCEMLERVFADEDTQVTESNERATANKLPRVKSLILEELPNFGGCCQDGCAVEWLSLKRVRVVKCPMIQKSLLGWIDRPLLTSVEVVDCSTWAKNEDPEGNIKHLFGLTDELSRLVQLPIKGSEELKKYIEMELELLPTSFSQLTILEARQCGQELNKFLSILLRRSPELTELTVENCGLLEQVFDLRDSAPDKQGRHILFSHLKTLRLCGLPKLNCIWNSDPLIGGTVKLGNLVKLEMIECGFLKGPLSTALLEKLVLLKIESCKMMEQVVEENAELQGSLFRNLEDLQLVSLPKFTKFTKGHCNFTFPNLRSLRIEKCPELNAFTAGFLSNQTTNEGTSNNVRSDEYMDVCSKLQTLKLVGHEAFEEIWQGADCELKEVEVDSFSKLRYIFPSSMLPILLEKLDTLVVRNCGSLSNVFQPRQNASIMAFKNLKIVRVKGCDSLQRVLLPFSYPMLTELDVSDCQSLKEIFIDTEIKADEQCFPNLESIVLENLPMLSSFSLEIFEFPKLQKVRIVNCPDIRALSKNASAKASNLMDADCEIEEYSPFGHGKTVLLPQLEELELSDLPKMQIWNQEPQIPVFQKLTSLKIIGCGSIEQLFSISVAQHLSSLKSLTLYKCENMVQVFHGGGGAGSFEFKKLETLVLKHLPRLTSFSEDVITANFPELNEVRVEVIPKMKTFVKHSLQTPKLKVVYVTYVMKCWKGDLNKTITYLHEKHEEFTKKVWRTDQSSPGNSLKSYADAAESSSQGMKRTSWSFKELETELH